MRKERELTFNNQTKKISQWSLELGIKVYTIKDRLRRKLPIEQVLSTKFLGIKANDNINIAGKTFDKLYVTGKKKRDNDNTIWQCICDCGSITWLQRYQIISQSVRSCGCLNHRKGLEHPSATHGMSRWPEYDVWNMMRQRCENPNCKAFDLYGGAGRKVCKGFTAFINFINKLGRRPNKDAEIDRLNNKLGYTCGECSECLEKGWPFNCAWRTRVEQMNNTSMNHFIAFNDKTLTIAQWHRETGITCAAIQRRLKNDWSIEDTLTKPMRTEISITFNDKTHTLVEWSKILKISRRILYWRYWQNWSPEKIVTTPYLGHKH